MPEPDRAGVGLGHAELDLERREVHDGEQRGVLLDGRLLRHGEVADDAVDRRAARPARRRGARGRRPAAAGGRAAGGASAARTRGSSFSRPADRRAWLCVSFASSSSSRARWKSRSLMTFWAQACSARANSRSAARIATPAMSLVCWPCRTLRRTSISWRLQIHAQALERRLLALELVAQARAVDGGEQVALPDRVTGVARVADGAGRRRVERRAHRGDDRGLGRHVAHELAARDRCDAHALARHRGIGRAPALQQPRRAPREPAR